LDEAPGTDENADEGPRDRGGGRLDAQVADALALLIALAASLDELDLEDVELASGPPCWP